ncbi:hypothetical protein BC829DRAFT_442952 [Chytridium lagenaria]|nr:hypothetical protein BC829DRAFT_442952 [Chytridium lagenaria]
MVFKNPFGKPDAKEKPKPRDDAVSREMVKYILDSLSADLTILTEKRWITQETLEMILEILESQGLQADSNSGFIRGKGTSQNDDAPPTYGTSPKSSAPPPLPSRGPSSPSISYRPTPSSKPNLPSRNPTSATTNASFGGNFLNTQSTPSSSPFLQRAAMSAASNPAVQKAAYNTASNPAVQKAALNAASSAASNPDVQKAAFSGISNPSMQKAAHSAASNPAFQKAAYSAASNPAVQKAAFSAASNPALQKAAFNAASGAAGMPKPAPPIPGRIKVTAVADYNGEDGDLSFRVGDLITVLEDIDENWYRGELRNKQGMFPKNHVELQR